MTKKALSTKDYLVSLSKNEQENSVIKEMYREVLFSSQELADTQALQALHTEKKTYAYYLAFIHAVDKPEVEFL
jgi:uncharacterized membrane protein